MKNIPFPVTPGPKLLVDGNIKTWVRVKYISRDFVKFDQFGTSESIVKTLSSHGRSWFLFDTTEPVNVTIENIKKPISNSFTRYGAVIFNDGQIKCGTRARDYYVSPDKVTKRNNIRFYESETKAKSIAQDGDEIIRAKMTIEVLNDEQ